MENKDKGRGLNAGGADERELEEALQRSLQEMKEKEGNRGGGNDSDEDAPGVGTVLNRGKAKQQEEEKKFQAFKG